MEHTHQGSNFSTVAILILALSVYMLAVIFGIITPIALNLGDIHIILDPKRLVESVPMQQGQPVQQGQQGQRARHASVPTGHALDVAARSKV